MTIDFIATFIAAVAFAAALCLSALPHCNSGSPGFYVGHVLMAGCP
jgi:hypothetical protein